MNEKDIEIYKKWQKSPIEFIKDQWGLIPQSLKSEYKEQFNRLYNSEINNWADEVSDEWFEPFEKGKNITWQQYLFLLSVEGAINGIGKKRISIESGHGTGKTAGLSWLILWYLFCHKDAQIPCTAPTSTQIHDVLWKELATWLRRMRPEMADLFDPTSEYLRVKESPETWFARAKTARKEAPEALAGIHGRFVMFVIDEASGVPEEIFQTAEGALTQENIIVIMISNHTRTNGYFHDSHTTDKHNWQRLSFNSEKSPIVEDGYIERIADKEGKDSNEYRIRVLGKAPIEEGMDKKGFVPLFNANDIRLVPESDFVGVLRLGIDPSGEGTDLTTWVLRDNLKAKAEAKEVVSNPKSIAEKTMTLMTLHDVKDENIMVDSFGVGADVGKELALSDNHYNVGTVNVGENKYNDVEVDDIYQNIRAEAYFGIKEWFKRGGSIIDNELGRKLRGELLDIRFKRNLRGKIIIKSKLEMRNDGVASPNFADALMLTFVKKNDGLPIKQFDGCLQQDYD
jgi:hypothetical protein